MVSQSFYTAKLQSGLGLVAETKLLLHLWEQGMSATTLYKVALESGQFPGITARRLRNIVMECFAPRYLSNGAAPATALKVLLSTLSSDELLQFLLLFTCRSTPVLADFIQQVYWPRYAMGDRELPNEVAREFLERAIDDGKTIKRWSPHTVKRIAGNLTGCCADYGLLEDGVRRKRRFLSVNLADRVAVYLAYNLHWQGLSDAAILRHPDWTLFGLNDQNVLAEIKKLALDGWFLVQSGGEVVRISWKYSDMKELVYGLAEY
jgi:hypothetical protein